MTNPRQESAALGSLAAGKKAKGTFSLLRLIQKSNIGRGRRVRDVDIFYLQIVRAV